ncbi:MAG TPA: hypothetical protein VKU80_14215 [Planctomycetota bacterium]|nr:hypothetical protein [Planctomycetota bacterium]
MDEFGKKSRRRKSSSPVQPPDPQTADKMAAVGKMISPSCVPLYSRISNNNSTPEIQGTGTLLRLGSHHLMLTAGHVADLSGRQGKTLCIRRYNDPKMAFLPFSSKMG